MKKNKYTIILASALIFGCILTPMLTQAKSTKLVFNGSEWTDPSLVPPPATIIFVEDNVLHVKDFWSMHLFGGTFGDEEISGWTQSLFHIKHDLITNEIVGNGQTWFYITWGDLTGYFTGTIIVKVVNGLLNGKFTIHGFEDFEGMKIFGVLWGNIETNYFAGTLLIPN